MDDLLRCPFCGSAARLWVWADGGGVCVKCINANCGCQTPTHYDELMRKDSAVEKAINEWNRRVGEKENRCGT